MRNSQNKADVFDFYWNFLFSVCEPKNKIHVKYNTTMSSLKTLLDAARFLELQELQEQEKQHRATVVEAALATMETSPILPTIVTTDNIIVTHSNPKTVASSPPQAVVISSSNVSSTFLHTPMSYQPAASAAQVCIAMKKLCLIL